MKMNFILKENIGGKILSTWKNLIHTSNCVGRRPPDFRSVMKKYRRFPYFKMYYDEDSSGPLNVVIDEINNYPPGTWGSMSIKDSWKFYKEGKRLRILPTYFDKLESMTWTEYNLWYHTLKLPLQFPETREFCQFLTRTRVIDHVPDSVKDSFNNIYSEEIGKTSKYLKIFIDNYNKLASPFCPSYDKDERRRQSNELICQMMDTIVRARSNSDFYQNYSTSPNSIIETFIKRGGYDRLEAPEIVKDSDGFVKYRIKGNLAWQLRSKDVLKEFINGNDHSIVFNGTNFNTYDYHPKMFNLEPADCEAFKHLPFTYSIHTNEYARNIPGYWGNSPFKVGDPCAFSVLGVVNTHLSRELEDQYLLKHPEIIDNHHLSEAIMAGFTWTVAQAQNQGFSIYDELTYPFCACILLTDGLTTQMTYYQLNSMTALWKPEDANLPANFLWFGPKMKLYEYDSTGEVAHIDEHAIHQILATFSMPKLDLSTEELQPYLKDTAPRDLTELMIDFDPNTATEKEIEEYRVNSRNKQIFKYGKSHPNRMFYFDEPKSHDLGEMLRDIVPAVDRVPERVIRDIKAYKLKREMVRRGKHKCLREPKEWM